MTGGVSMIIQSNAPWVRFASSVFIRSDDRSSEGLGGVALLLVFAAPVTQMRLGQPDDGNKAESLTQRVAYDQQTAANEVWETLFWNRSIKRVYDLPPAYLAGPAPQVPE